MGGSGGLSICLSGVGVGAWGCIWEVCLVGLVGRSAV